MTETKAPFRFLTPEQIEYLNVEISTKCSLRCPMCPRTIFPDNVDLNHEMPLSFVKHLNLSPALKKIYLAGANGDPTQHSQFHEVVRILKEVSPAQLNFHTHGCFHSAPWWEKLLDIMDPTDHIVFSIDGLEDTNKIYRINSNWKHIELAARLAAKKVKTTWKYIVFAHNEHQIEEAMEMAREWGITWFSLKKSDRWTDAYRPDGADDSWMSDLRPSDKYVNLNTVDPNVKFDINKKFNNAGHFAL